MFLIFFIDIIVLVFGFLYWFLSYQIEIFWKYVFFIDIIVLVFGFLYWFLSCQIVIFWKYVFFIDIIVLVFSFLLFVLILSNCNILEVFMAFDTDILIHIYIMNFSVNDILNVKIVFF